MNASSPDITLENSQLPVDPRKARVQYIIEGNMGWAILLSLVPYPIMVGMFIKIIQLKMIHQLSVEYNVKFTEHLGKSILLVLVAGITAGAFVGVLRSVISRHNPMAIALGNMTLAIGTGALTYAVGKIIAHHFESGGTLDNLNIEKSRQHLSRIVEDGKVLAKKMVTK